MSYDSAVATIEVQALSVSVVLAADPMPPWVAGSTVSLEVTATENGNPLTGCPTRIVMGSFPDAVYVIAEGTTNDQGKFVPWGGWSVPWYVGVWDVWAEVTVDSAIINSNAITGAILYDTRISIDAPERVVVGKEFTVTGKLEYEKDAGVWMPLSGETVRIYYDGTLIVEAVTDSDGNYTATAVINTSGTYTLKVLFSGGGTLALAERETAITAEGEIPFPWEIILVGAGGIFLLSLIFKK